MLQDATKLRMIPQGATCVDNAFELTHLAGLITSKEPKL